MWQWNSLFRRERKKASSPRHRDFSRGFWRLCKKAFWLISSFAFLGYDRRLMWQKRSFGDIKSFTFPRAWEWMSEHCEQTDERVVQYLYPNSRLFWTTVRRRNWADIKLISLITSVIKRELTVFFSKTCQLKRQLFLNNHSSVKLRPLIQLDFGNRDDTVMKNTLCLLLPQICGPTYQGSGTVTPFMTARPDRRRKLWTDRGALQETFFMVSPLVKFSRLSLH